MLVSVGSVSELNKIKVRLFIEAVVNDGRLELIDELVGADYVGHMPHVQGRVLGPEGVRRLVASRRRTHPDLQVKIDDQIAEGDRVATVWRITTRTPGRPGAGSRPAPGASWSGISIIRLLAGKQVDSHTEYTERGRE